MKTRNRNLIFGVGIILLSVGLIAGCTNSFCSDDDKSRIMFAIDPGVSTYIDASQKDAYIAHIDEVNAELEDDKKSTYVVEKVFEDNENLYRVIERNSDGYYYQSKNILITLYNADKTVSYESALKLGKDPVVNEGIKAAIEKTTSAGGYKPSLDYYMTFDKIAFELAIQNYNVAHASDGKAVDQATLTSDQATEVLNEKGPTKFTYSDADEKKEMYNTFNKIHRQVVAEIGIEKSASDNYLTNYVSNMNTQTNNLRSCIATFGRDGIKYGNYGSYGTSVDIETKSWGYAWSKGFFEGLLVYPVAWMIDAFTNLFGGVKANAVPQLLALIVVTVIVRLFIFAATFPSTIQQQKMQALQPEVAKIQAKYPNSNTSQAEKQRLAQEQQALYKKHKVHPLLQLLVMVIQFPVFICVWGAMTGSSVLSTGQLLGLHLSSSIMSALMNFSGWPGNGGWWTALVLFLLMAGSQFLSMKLPQWIQKARTKKVARLGVNPAQNQQNKTMNIISYVMLAVIIFMGFSLPAAMGVYWFVGALVSLAQSFITQAIVNNSFKKKKK